DVGLDDVRAVGLPGPADLLEDGQGAVPRCGRPEQRPAGGQLAHEDVLAPGPVQARVGGVQLADVVQETADGGVVGVGVLADVEGGQVQPGTGERLHRPAQPAAGDELAAVRHEGAGHDVEVG